MALASGVSATGMEKEGMCQGDKCKELVVIVVVAVSGCGVCC
jgi:hypothetical protein